MIKAQTSTTRYPQCLAATCASVVFPSPGGPHSRSTCRSKKLCLLMTLQLIGNPPGIFAWIWVDHFFFTWHVETRNNRYHKLLWEKRNNTSSFIKQNWSLGLCSLLFVSFRHNFFDRQFKPGWKLYQNWLTPLGKNDISTKPLTSNTAKHRIKFEILGHDYVCGTHLLFWQMVDWGLSAR